MSAAQQPTDAELVGKTLDGDHDAYKLLIMRYQGHVYGLAYGVVNRWSEAQDVAQEAFLRAYCNLGQLRDPARFAPWLRRIAFATSMNWLRRPGPVGLGQPEGQAELDGSAVADPHPGPAEMAARQELADIVLAAIAALPEKYRVPLTMFHLDGLSYQKVADFLDIPLGTVKGLIHRAKRRLRPALEAYVQEVNPMVAEVFNEHRLPDDFAERIRQLMAAEIPEVAEGKIAIRGVALDPGVRVKVAVACPDPEVDAVGACIGERACRITRIADGLDGEKIDVLCWHEAPELLIRNALFPAEPRSVDLDADTHRVSVVVTGEDAQCLTSEDNSRVRLAASLTGWEIDVRVAEASSE